MTKIRVIQDTELSVTACIIIVIKLSSMKENS